VNGCCAQALLTDYEKASLTSLRFAGGLAAMSGFLIAFGVSGMETVHVK